MMKKSIAIASLSLLVGIVVGWLAIPHVEYSKTNNTKKESKKPLYWVAPMDDNYRRDKPGKSPMGMDLVPVYTENTQAEGVTISPRVANNIGIKIAPVQHRDMVRQISTLGIIKENDNHIEHIHAYETGWVHKLYIKEIGKKVKKGELVASIYSPKLIEAEQELVLALNSKPHRQQSTNNTRYQDTIDYVESAKLKLRALNVSEQQIKRIIKNRKAETLIDLHAPIDGVLSELNTKEGMYITPQTNLMTIVDLSSVWLSADIFPKDAHLLKLGDTLTGQVEGINNKTFSGKITFISPTIDPMTRTVSVRATLENHDNALKPNLYMSVSIDTSPLTQILSIPVSSVIRLKSLDYVILSLPDNHFVAQEVKLGIESNGFYQILDGLKTSDQVVTSAQFLIDSESNIQASLRRLTTEKEQAHDMSHQKMPSVQQDMTHHHHH